MTASRPPLPILGYSSLTGTVYVFKRNGQKEAVPTEQWVAALVGYLDDHNLIVKKDGFRVRYGVEEILPAADAAAAPGVGERTPAGRQKRTPQ